MLCRYANYELNHSTLFHSVSVVFSGAIFSAGIDSVLRFAMLLSSTLVLNCLFSLNQLCTLFCSKFSTVFSTMFYFFLPYSGILSILLVRFWTVCLCLIFILHCILFCILHCSSLVQFLCYFYPIFLHFLSIFNSRISACHPFHPFPSSILDTSKRVELQILLIQWSTLA